MLSSAMIKPDQTWFIPNLSVRIFGINASYACQNAQMRKNAKPTKKVRLLFSFIFIVFIVCSILPDV